MSIPLNQRILVRQATKEVRMLTTAIQNFLKQSQVSKPEGNGNVSAPVITCPLEEYIKLVADARRIQYIIAGIALAEKGINLPMPTDKSATNFRANLDLVINKLLEELSNTKSIITLDDSDEETPPDENNDENKIIM